MNQTVLELQEDTLGRLADLIAERLTRRLAEEIAITSERKLVGREELASLAGLGIRTIDRLAKGGSWERDPMTGAKVWKPTAVKLVPIKQGGRVLFDKVESLAAIKAGT